LVVMAMSGMSFMFIVGSRYRGCAIGPMIVRPIMFI
jgi:hypothetical protein